MAEPTEPKGGQSSDPAANGEKEEKPQWEQTLDDLGLPEIPKMYHLFTEGGWIALATAGAVAGAAILVGSIRTSAMLASKNIMRQALSFASPRGENGERQTRVRNPASDYGGYEWRSLETVMREEREQRLAAAGRNGAAGGEGGGPGGGGGGGGTGPTPDSLEALRSKLALVNPLLDTFNKEIRKVPKASDLAKTATGIGKVNTVVTNAKPTDIEKVAEATGKLVAAQSGFDPKKLPKARGLAAAATQAERLAKAGGEVKTAFDNLKAAAQAAERVIAAG
ncbi:hypothetical protein [Streptomyces sp. NPDC056264]|uniref:hypothetical protein n=1 Tax=Streptomyces sp. NPDC056264 TaxID=3345767 RepID=UPI003AAC5BFA